MVWLLAGLVWLVLWLTGFWLAAIAPAGFFVWSWWAGAPNPYMPVFAAAFLVPWLIRMGRNRKRGIVNPFAYSIP